MAGGIVYLVGAGPGDPGLVTARALACIRRADVVVYDRLVCPALVAQCRPGAELIYVGKDVGRHGQRQSDINEILVSQALAGKRVCRLKGGDPFVFGRGGEEAERLVAVGIPFEVVPGVTAGIAAPAFAGIPVTHRDYSGSVTLVTGHDAPCKDGPAVDWADLAVRSGTLLIYMGGIHVDTTASSLIAVGRSPDTPVAVIRWGTTAAQQTVTGTLRTIAADVQAAGLTAPVMIVVGEVVRLQERLAWAERRPMFGLRALVPVIGRDGSDLADSLRDAGAEVWEWPVAVDGVPRTDLGALLTDALPQVDGVFIETPTVLEPLLAVAADAIAKSAVVCQDAATRHAAEAAGLRVTDRWRVLEGVR